jgi:hypothetical protein
MHTNTIFFFIKILLTIIYGPVSKSDGKTMILKLSLEAISRESGLRVSHPASLPAM